MTEIVRQSAADELADRFWDRVLDLSPITASVYGIERNPDKLDDPGPEGREQWRRLYADTLAEVERLGTTGETAGATSAQATEDTITLDMLAVICRLGLRQQQERVDRLRVLDQAEGPQTILPLIASLQPLDTPERVDAFVARLHAYPAFIDANVDLVREGLASGLTAARIITERVVGQLDRMLAQPVEASPIIQAARVTSDGDRTRIADAVRDVVRPADARFLEALRSDYLAASRAEPGLWSAPNGDALYRTQILAWTTLDLDPAEVHQLGLDQLESIERERREISRALGFGDDTAAAREAVRADPANKPKTREELLERARGQIERAMAGAPSYFGRLPKSPVEVRPVEEFKEADAPPAYYYPPAADGSRPGIYFVNTYDLPSRSYVSLANTSYHEAAPGHHFQIAIEIELEGLNNLRRLGSRMAGTAYTEGWGLYSERLADEMGLYLNPAERMGMLDGQSWRAARLVVDTGIHAFRWNRDQAIDLLQRSGLTRTDAVSETDRYIAWPAQALTYKIGQREIERLRAEISARLGAAFDLRAFHDAVLGHGTLPLSTMTRELPRWLGAAD